MVNFEDAFPEFQVWKTQNVQVSFKMELEVTQNGAVRSVMDKVQNQQINDNLGARSTTLTVYDFEYSSCTNIYL